MTKKILWLKNFCDSKIVVTKKKKFTKIFVTKKFLWLNIFCD